MYLNYRIIKKKHCLFQFSHIYEQYLCYKRSDITQSRFSVSNKNYTTVMDKSNESIKVTIKFSNKSKMASNAGCLFNQNHRSALASVQNSITTLVSHHVTKNHISYSQVWYVNVDDVQCNLWIPDHVRTGSKVRLPDGI